MRARLSRPSPRPQTIAGRGSIPRHRHRNPYAALVLDGTYEEAGDWGHVLVEAGDIVVHPAFDAHLDRTGRAHVRLLNVPLPTSLDWRGGVVRGAGKELFAVARRGEYGALTALMDPDCLEEAGSMDWPDALAAALRSNPSIRLEEWARAAGLRPETVSRGFASVYGVSPKRYRAEARAHAAVAALRRDRRPMSTIAADLGFADQAHMSRAVRALTGCAASQVAAGSSAFKPARAPVS